MIGRGADRELGDGRTHEQALAVRTGLVLAQALVRNIGGCIDRQLGVQPGVVGIVGMMSTRETAAVRRGHRDADEQPRRDTRDEDVQAGARSTRGHAGFRHRACARRPDILVSPRDACNFGPNAGAAYDATTLAERLMPRPSPSATTLAGTTVIVTRPSSEARPLVALARAAGAFVVRLPGLVLRDVENRDAAREALADASGGDIVVFTSPASVRHAFALGFAPRDAAMRVLAVGGGTASVLARHRTIAISPPERQDGDGLLALPELADVAGARIAIVDAPGGRDAIAPALRARGASVSRIHVYRRAPARLTRRHHAALAAAPRPWITLLSSGETLDHLGRALPADLAARWRGEALVVSSARLAALAAEAGFTDVTIAVSARPADLIEAACSRVAPRPRS